MDVRLKGVLPDGTEGVMGVVPTSEGKNAEPVVIKQPLGGASRNRELSAVTTRQSITWQDGFKPTKSLEITLAPNGEAYICFDAPNDAVADAWLADAGSSSTDSMRHYVADETLKPQGNIFLLPDLPLTRMDIILVSGTLTKVYVEAE